MDRCRCPSSNTIWEHTEPTRSSVTRASSTWKVVRVPSRPVSSLSS